MAAGWGKFVALRFAQFIRDGQVVRDVYVRTRENSGLERLFPSGAALTEGQAYGLCAMIAAGLVYDSQERRVDSPGMVYRPTHVSER